MPAPSCSSFPCWLPMAPPLPAPRPPYMGCSSSSISLPLLPACSSSKLLPSFDSFSSSWAARSRTSPLRLTLHLLFLWLLSVLIAEGTLVIKRDDVQEVVEYTIMKSWYSLEE
ncbi:hypothetical protein BS78_06G121600 [Paspalum vaginatum]|nr:hypothetical protein BS78_06G121600 [Paspalum vaginatum]